MIIRSRFALEPINDLTKTQSCVHILSDLHLEFAPFQPNKVDADVVVLAGDVHTGTNGIKWILEAFRDKPVIYVLGNHEFYGQKIQKLIASIKEIAQGTNVHVLDNDRVGSTRVIANPRRCPTEPHIGFDPALVIEV